MIPVIDMHTHIFPDDLAPRAIAKLIENSPNDHNFTDGTASGLQKSMKCNNITRSVTLPIATKKEQVRIINTQQSEADRSFLIPFGTLHPDLTNYDDEISFLVSQKIPGIKLHPEYQNFYFHEKKFFPMYEALSDAGLLVVFHAGKDPGPFSCDHSLPAAFKMVRKNFPSLKIIAAHMGGWRIWETVLEELCDTNILFDTSAVYGLLDKGLFMQIACKHGTDRLVFGSDSPWFHQGDAVKWIDSLPLGSNEKEMIFIKNAIALLSY